MSARKDPLPTGSWLGFDDLDAHADAFDALVAETPDVDHFCSSTDWILPARAAFAPNAMPYVMAEDGACVALMRIPAEPRHEVAVPLEAGWGLASPFAGRDPAQIAEMLGTMVEHAPHPPDALFLSGIVRDSPLYEHVILRLTGRYRIGTGPPSGRRSTSIVEGLDGFLSRRSPGFRASLRRAERRAAADGFVLTYDSSFEGAEVTTERVMAVEARSWKGIAGQGVDRGPARRFYEMMIARLVGRGTLRLVFVRRGGEDVAFCLGGLFGDSYRGLQVSFAEGYERWAPGNLAQLAMIRGLGEEGVHTYHLGMEMPYKARWAEPGLETITLALLPW